VDSIGKKIKVVDEVGRELGLNNLTAINARAECIGGGFDYVVSRAVAPLASLKEWVWGKIERGEAGTLPNGLIALKGGDLTDEISAAGGQARIFNIADLFTEEFFETKRVVYMER
jgi:16S rRNA (guanine527-N7)-methyltransferase